MFVSIGPQPVPGTTVDLGLFSQRAFVIVAATATAMASQCGTCDHAGVVTPVERHGAPASSGISPLRKAVLLLDVWKTALRVQVALRRHGMPSAIAKLEDSAATRARHPVPLLSRAVSRGLRVGSWQPRCLIRSMVLYDLLRKQGDPAELVIGLKEQASSSDAHAWVELEGRDIGPLPGGRGYLELTRYPAPPRRSIDPSSS